MSDYAWLQAYLNSSYQHQINHLQGELNLMLWLTGIGFVLLGCAIVLLCMRLLKRA